MAFKTRELTVDLVNATPTKEMSFYQGDENSVKLILNITNEGQELDLGQAKAVRITFNKSDGKTVFQEDCKPINALKGKYQIILKTQTLAAVGNVYAQVRIFIEDRKLDAEPFVFTVKQSYSGDTAVESKNEFTIIQRALEVGEKFQNVDFDPIIKAGALAQGALPKTGGTMTGPLTTESKVTWKNKEGTGEVDFAVASDGVLWITDKKTGQTVATIKDGIFDIKNSNLVKKAGDTMTGNMKLDRPGAANYRWFTWSTAGVDDMSFGMTGTGTFVLQDVKNNRTVLSYDPATRALTQYGESNLLKNTGGEMTGPLILSADNAEVNFKNSKSEVTMQKTPTGTIALWDRGNQKTAWQYRPETQEFVVNAPNTNVITKDKNGRATITVTADAELAGANGVIADRRGQTVTLRAPIRRKAGVGHAAVMFVMPEGMRPLVTIQQTMVSTDGSVGTFTIDANGNVTIANPTATDVSGKNFYATITYVVD